MKICYTGKESSGKSLKLAKVCKDLVYRNSKWLKKSGIMRPIASNLIFSKEFEEYAKNKGIQIIYWSNLDDLISLRDCDIIIDEISNYFDARGWKELNLDVRRWMSQGAKIGNEMYTSAQDFAQVDIAFRRLINHLYKINKVIGSRRPSATRPPVKKIWGICVMSELDPLHFDEENDKFNRINTWPKIYFINRQDCEIFDTKQEILKSKPLTYKHIERYCQDPKCTYKHTEHI
jgi:hypothetical protein